MDIQFTSDDGTVGPNDVMYEWSQLFIAAGETMGRTFKIARQSRELIQAAGFVDVVEKKYKVPVGRWMEDRRWKEIGTWNLLYLTEGLEGMALYILKNVLHVRFPFLLLGSFAGRMTAHKRRLCDVGIGKVARRSANGLLVGLHGNPSIHRTHAHSVTRQEEPRLL
jgi:hypothetical protein